MISLKKALAGISMLAIIVVSFSCHNNSSSDFNDNTNTGGSTSNNPSDSTGELAGSGISFDLSNAKSFFAGNASTATASRSAARSLYDDNNNILMKITDDGTILPAMDSQASNINFNISKILKNPATKELFLLGNFNKWSSYDDDTSWDYNLIKVAQDGKWYGLPNFWFSITQEPFDESGNFYFNYNGDIYKYSGSTATKIVENAELKRVLPNGAIVYTVSISSLNSTTYYTYVKLRDGTPVQLDDYSTSIYIKDKNILYYYIKYIPKDETTYYVDDEGNKYDYWNGNEWVRYANKGGKKIYVTEVDGQWKDENGKLYDKSVCSRNETLYWTTDDVGNKIYLTHFPYYYKDKDGNKYYDEDVFYDNEKYNYYTFSESGEKIEVEYVQPYYEDAQGTRYEYTINVKYESNLIHWVYEGGEEVKVEHKYGRYQDEYDDRYSDYYQDEYGNKYAYYETYDVLEYYVTQNGKKVKVTPAQKYSTDALVAKYYDFITNEVKEAVAEADFSNISSSYDYFTTSSENVSGTTFITNNVWKFEIQNDFSLKCTYNLSEKGYTVGTTWNNYGYIGENNERYLEKFLYAGERIYFLGTKGAFWTSDSTYNLYRIARFGEPEGILSDASNYAFNGDITFDDDGNFIGSVFRKSDSKFGILSGNMERKTYSFQENNIFESVTDIVINFD